MGNIVSGFQTSPLRPDRPPICCQSGAQALFRAEQIDNYRMIVEQSPINTRARSGQNYLPSLVSVSKEIPSIDSTQPWPSGQVVWMDPTADAGLPHTRAPDLICISRDFPSADLPTTILHERVHVSQRLHPEAWRDIFEPWQFKIWNGSFPSEIDSKRRINPDLLGVPQYIWKDTWVPLALFKSMNQPKLNEVDVVWWDDKTRTLLRDPPPGWTAFFGSISAGEHPYELVAYLVASNPKQNVAYSMIKSRLEALPTKSVF
jgi:hypothetical protein